MSLRDERRYRKCTFRVWKKGARADVKFYAPSNFERSSVTDLLDRERIFAVDTESLTKDGALKTLLVPVHFHDHSETIETLDGRGMLHLLFEAIWRQGYAVPQQRPSRTKQRAKALREGRGLSRDGDRASVPIVLSVWFNLPYDFGRLVSDAHKHLLRTVVSGADSYRLAISSRFELEVRKMHFGSAASFDWRIRCSESKTMVHLLGIDLCGYWKKSLALSAKAVGVAEKIDIESVIEGVYERPFESFTPTEWTLFRDYGVGDVRSTLELYHATAELLTTIDARVVRSTGVIPPSAPGASATIMFAKAFDCHPESSGWERYPAMADQMGADAYYGGRVFATCVGIHSRMATLDLKSAYPFQLSLVPDPVEMQAVPVRESTDFRVEDWTGAYGVLYVSGESLDDVYPAFRIHDPSRHGRLRYVAGAFANVAVTIPEIVIGVLRGSLRIDRIHRGVRMVGSAERSFLREGVKIFFDIKEDATNAKALRDMAKLLANSAYGKLIEVQAQEYLIAERMMMPRFDEKEAVCRSITKVFTACGPRPDAPEAAGVYWGEDLQQQTFAQEAYLRHLDAWEGIEQEEKGPEAVGWYVQALALANVKASVPTLCSVAQYVQGFRSFKAGQFFMPLYAAQITGATSAMVGLMAACLGALQGDTDSVHVKLPEGVGRIVDLPGYAHYFEVMEAAGYASPREAKMLGSWEEETPEPSVESLLARTKLYSHKFADGTYKQAQHGIARFHSPELDALLAGRAYSCVESRALMRGETREERGKLAKVARAEALHEAVRALITTGKFSYDARKSPRKIKEAVARGLQVGEFISRPMDLVLGQDPNTWRDAEGITRWKPLAPGEEHYTGDNEVKGEREAEAAE